MATVLLLLLLLLLSPVSVLAHKRKHPRPTLKMGQGFCEQDWLAGYEGNFTTLTCRAACLANEDCVYFSAAKNKVMANGDSCTLYGEFTSCSQRITNTSWALLQRSFKITARLDFDEFINRNHQLVSPGMCDADALISSYTGPVTVADCMGQCVATGPSCGFISVSKDVCGLYTPNCTVVLSLSDGFSTIPQVPRSS